MQNKIKKLLLISIFISLNSSAGLFDSMMTADFKTKQLTAKYKIDVYGYDARVYEWMPKDNPNIRCMLVAGSKNSTGVACYSIKD